MLQALVSSLAAIVERPPPAARVRNTPSTPASLSGDNIGPSTSPDAAAAAATTKKKKKVPSDALSLLKHRPGLDGAALGSPAASPASPAASESDPAIANVFYGLKPLPEVVSAQKSPPGRGRSKTASAASRSSKRVTARTAQTGSPTGSAAARPSTAGGVRAMGGGKSTLSRTGKELVYTGEIGRIGLREGGGDGEGGAGALRSRLLAAGR